MTRVLLVEDDPEIRGLLKDFLTEKGYACAEAADGSKASEKLHAECFDIILMDMMLPYRSGDSLIRELRDEPDVKKRNTPVIVISAKSGKDTRLEVLRMGADDYIIKPFDLDEVLVRIEVVLRRSAEDGNKKTKYSYGGIELDTERNAVSCCGTELRLTAKELRLLCLFFENPDRTFSKAKLYEAVWGEDYAYEDNTINVHMSNLRSKLRKAAGEEMIETVWGIGYKLRKG